jgi:hypothetical protein
MRFLDRIVKTFAITAAIAGLAVFTPAFAAPITFETHVDYPAAQFPFRVASADLNGDGRADLITSNPAPFNPPSVVSVLLNLGDGTFAPAVFYPTGAPGRSVSAGDLDGDGDQDLAVGLQEGDFRVAVLENDSQGHFAAPDLLAPIAGRPDGIAITDLDRDGDQDILIAQAAGDEVVVLRNLGGGTFAPPSAQAGMTDAYFVHLAVGDVDNDGAPDLAISRSLSGLPASLYHNRGDGTFEPRQALPAGTFEYAGGDFGDLDGDQDLDLVLVSELGPRVLMLRNNGAGAFSAVGTFPSGVETQFGGKVTIADLDADGQGDVIVPAANTYRVGILRSNGAGLEAATFHELGGQPTHVVASDLDEDGDLDLASALPHSDELSVLLNVSSGTTGVDGAGAGPRVALSFGPAFSNPTPLGATIPYVLPAAAQVRIAVLDVAGRRIRGLFAGERPAGSHVVTWDGRNDGGVRVGAGVYLVEMDGGSWRRTARIVVIP